MSLVLVTGGAGFIGANLLRQIDDAHDVRVLDNLLRGRRELLPSDRDIELMVGDIRDPDAVARAVRGVDMVIHLAAFGSVVESVTDPVENFDINARGTFEVLRGAANAGVDRFIFASTGGAIMGDQEPPIDEDSLPWPISPYGASKLCGEAYLHAFAGSFGMRPVALRFANVYGPFSYHKGSVVATNLKVSGVAVFSAGDFIAADGTETIVLNDARRGAYKKLVIANGRLTGAVLVGETQDALWYLDLIRTSWPIAKIRGDMMFGRSLAVPAKAA